MLKTKAEVMNDVALHRAHESFSHTICGIFDVTQMRNFAIANDRVVHTLALTQELIDWLYENRDVDEARMRSMTRMQVDEAAIVVAYNDGTDLLIDGTHRMIAAWKKYGLKTFNYWKYAEYEIIRPAPGWGVHTGLRWGKFDINRHGEVVML